MTNRLSLAPTLLNQPATQSWTQARVQDQVLDGYTFSTTTTFPGMSVSGAVRLNSGTAASITQIAVSKLASASVGIGTNRSDDLLILGMGDWVTLREQGAPSNYMRFRVTGAPTDGGNYIVVPVSVYDPTGGAYTFMPYANGAPVFLGREAGAPTNGSTTQFWRGDGTFAAASGGPAFYASPTAGPPSNGVGVDGDLAFPVGSTTEADRDVTPTYIYKKVSGAWTKDFAAFSTDAAARFHVIPTYSKSMLHGPAPSWTCVTLPAWAATPPTDISSGGLSVSTNDFFATTAGTLGWLTGPDPNAYVPNASMAFHAHRCNVTTLPEATRFLWFGALACSGGGLYGFAARVDSAGTVTLWKMDSFGGDTQITATGTLTLSAGDLLHFERFGPRLTVKKGTTGTSSGPLVAGLEAYIGNNVGFANFFAAGSFGFGTTANSVRVKELRFSG